MQQKNMKKRICRVLLWAVTLAVAVTSVGFTGKMLKDLALLPGNMEGKSSDAIGCEIMDRYDMYVTNALSSALEGIVVIDRVYWLSDSDQVAPEPDQSKFGQTDDPSTLGWLLEDAAMLLDGQETLFSTDLQQAAGTPVRYYLDDTILAITWKIPINGTMYTISEVKIAHPSQLRRFLAGGAYGSPIQLTTTEMAASVNAVVASSGDFYAFRRYGVIVYDGTVQRVNCEKVDTCYINDQGEMLFSYRGELPDVEAAQAFVDANNIRYSVAFGPVLIDGGACKDFSGYVLGEVTARYARAALCQMGQLHYLLVIAWKEGACQTALTVKEMQQQLAAFGCEKAYALDGGQTAVIVHNDELVNAVVYGEQRNISDIIYFATALPNEEKDTE